MRCRAKNKAGKPCAAPAVMGEKHCVMHSGRAAELGSKGGRRRAIFNPENLAEVEPPKTSTELQCFLAQAMVEVRSGKMDPRTANSIACLGAAFLRAMDLTEPEANQPELRNATAFQIYEAQWLREKKARWAADLEKRYQFPPPG
jgi:hypothetical protein